jgi:N-acetylmuramic acid 6-phosphate etherase
MSAAGRARTELANEASRSLSALTAMEIVRLMNEEDSRVPAAVAAVLPAVAAAADASVERLGRGGRLIYLGAGTSGRLAVMEAAEAGPTFGVPPRLVVGVIAGGPDALLTPREGVEDDAAAGAAQVAALDVGADDVVVGVSASGRTPFVAGALDEAGRREALTVALCCDDDAPLVGAASIAIVPLVGPEVLAGSTRLKAGSAQKLVLNALTTATMARLGRVHENLMVDVRATNEKLRRRAAGIVAQLTGRDGADVTDALEAAGWSARVASVMLARGVDASAARSLVDGGQPLEQLLERARDE